MGISTFITVIGLWLMVICSLACAVYMALLLEERYGSKERRIQTSAMLFFLFYAGIFISRIFYEWFPSLFVSCAPLFYACHTCAAPALYYIIFLMTSGERPRKFPRIHFVLPLAIPAVLTVWMCFVPFDVPLGIVAGGRALNAQWPVFSRVFSSIMMVELCFITGYILLSVLRLRQYLRSLPQSKRVAARHQLRWVNAMMVCVILAPTHPLITLFVTIRDTDSVYCLLLLCTLTIIAMEITLLYNLQQHNYPALDIRPKHKRTEAAPQTPAPGITEKAAVPHAGRTHVKHFSQKELDNYFRKHKPYLDPQVKLTTLAGEVGLTREELSKFINRTYGVNFNVFIGQWRLRELEALRKLKKNKDLPVKLLLNHAGFSYYNSYLRARREAEGRSGVNEPAEDTGLNNNQK